MSATSQEAKPPKWTLREGFGKLVTRPGESSAGLEDFLARSLQRLRGDPFQVRTLGRDFVVPENPQEHKRGLTTELF